MELAEIQDTMKKGCSKFYGIVISNENSIEDQLNALHAGGDSDMKTAIDAKMADCTALKVKIDALGDTDIHTTFVLGTTDPESHCVTYLGSLNDDQKKVAGQALMALFGW